MNPLQTGTSLTTLELEHFARILHALVPGFRGGALYDFDNRDFRASFGFDGVIQGEIEDFLEKQRGSWASGEAEELFTTGISDNSLLFSHIVTNHAEEPIGALVVIVQASSPDAADNLKKKMSVAINAIAATISGEFQLNAELNAMARELTERYEELNLVYDTVDQVHSFSAVRKALQQLVKNCCVYMDVPYVAILLLDKRISINHMRDELDFGNQVYIEEELNNIYGWTLKTNQSLVVNERKDPVWDEVKIKLPYKLLSCPVTDKIGNTLGILVSLKEQSGADFVNSDRNLLTVMANKASKIIQTNYDSLTGLLNIQAFKYFLEKIHFVPGQFTPESHTVLYIDLDHMQVINETMSHQAGDEALRNVAQLIKGLIRDIDVAARIGGDKFGVLLYNCSPDRGMTISKRISDEIKKQELSWNSKKIQLTACIGLASINYGTQNIAGALDDAEIACNAAKEEGKNRVSFFKFGDIDHTGMRDEMRWAQMLQDSLSKNELRLYCQKIQSLQKDDGPLHYELLLRAHDDEGYIVEPQKFIPAAERYKLMPAVDRWVITNALRELEEIWRNSTQRQVIWSINISGQSFRDDGFLEFVRDSLEKSPIPASLVCFEITETAAIGNLIAAQNLIKSLRELGCAVSLDDFGSGLSSFTYLKNLNVDYLKIDGSIVKDIVDNHIARAMVKAIKDVAQALQLETIGEYVENDAIAGQLSLLGVDYAQGYFIGRPLPLENVLQDIEAVPDKA